MPQRIHDITAGSRPVYQVVVSEDGGTVTIRYAEDHSKSLDLIASVVPALIETLRKVSKP